jgi:hypothetical protein
MPASQDSTTSLKPRSCHHPISVSPTGGSPKDSGRSSLLTYGLRTVRFEGWIDGKMRWLENIASAS